MDKNLNWAVLGTGVIANQMAQALQKMGNNYAQPSFKTAKESRYQL